MTDPAAVPNFAAWPEGARTFYWLMWLSHVQHASVHIHPNGMPWAEHLLRAVEKGAVPTWPTDEAARRAWQPEGD